MLGIKTVQPAHRPGLTRRQADIMQRLGLMTPGEAEEIKSHYEGTGAREGYNQRPAWLVQSGEHDQSGTYGPSPAHRPQNHDRQQTPNPSQGHYQRQGRRQQQNQHLPPSQHQAQGQYQQHDQYQEQALYRQQTHYDSTNQYQHQSLYQPQTQFHPSPNRRPMNNQEDHRIPLPKQQPPPQSYDDAPAWLRKRFPLRKKSNASQATGDPPSELLFTQPTRFPSSPQAAAMAQLGPSSRQDLPNFYGTNPSPTNQYVRSASQGLVPPWEWYRYQQPPQPPTRGILRNSGNTKDYGDEHATDNHGHQQWTVRNTWHNRSGPFGFDEQQTPRISESPPRLGIGEHRVRFRPSPHILFSPSHASSASHGSAAAPLATPPFAHRSYGQPGTPRFARGRIGNGEIHQRYAGMRIDGEEEDYAIAENQYQFPMSPSGVGEMQLIDVQPGHVEDMPSSAYAMRYHERANSTTRGNQYTNNGFLPITRDYHVNPAHDENNHHHAALQREDFDLPAQPPKSVEQGVRVKSPVSKMFGGEDVRDTSAPAPMASDTAQGIPTRLAEIHHEIVTDMGKKRRKEQSQKDISGRKRKKRELSDAERLEIMVEAMSESTDELDLFRSSLGTEYDWSRDIPDDHTITNHVPLEVDVEEKEDNLDHMLELPNAASSSTHSSATLPDGLPGPTRAAEKRARPTPQYRLTPPFVPPPEPSPSLYQPSNSGSSSEDSSDSTSDFDSYDTEGQDENIDTSALQARSRYPSTDEGDESGTPTPGPDPAVSARPVKPMSAYAPPLVLPPPGAGTVETATRQMEKKQRKRKPDILVKFRQKRKRARAEERAEEPLPSLSQSTDGGGGEDIELFSDDDITDEQVYHGQMQHQEQEQKQEQEAHEDQYGPQQTSQQMQQSQRGQQQGQYAQRQSGPQVRRLPVSQVMPDPRTLQSLKNKKNTENRAQNQNQAAQSNQSLDQWLPPRKRLVQIPCLSPVQEEDEDAPCQSQSHSKRSNLQSAGGGDAVMKEQNAERENRDALSAEGWGREEMEGFFGEGGALGFTIWRDVY